MSESVFPCKDCGVVFPSAYDFLDHVDTCANNYGPNSSLQLQNAAILLRTLIRSANRLANQEQVIDHAYAKRVKKDVNAAWTWLKVNNLQGKK